MSTYKVTYRTIRRHEHIGDYETGTDYVLTPAANAADARARVSSAAETAGFRVRILNVRNEDARYNRTIRAYEASRA
jgi:hypothetical protein